MMIAGSDTVGNASAVGTFHVLQNPEVLKTLSNELKEAWPEKEAHVGFEILEKLPYLVSFPRTDFYFDSSLMTNRPLSSKKLLGYPTGLLHLCHASSVLHLRRLVDSMFQQG